MLGDLVRASASFASRWAFTLAFTLRRCSARSRTSGGKAACGELELEIEIATSELGIEIATSEPAASCAVSGSVREVDVADADALETALPRRSTRRSVQST